MDLSSLFWVIDFEKSASLSVTTRETDLLRSDSTLATYSWVPQAQPCLKVLRLMWPFMRRHNQKTHALGPWRQCVRGFNDWLPKACIWGTFLSKFSKFQSRLRDSFVLSLLFPTNDCLQRKGKSKSFLKGLFDFWAKWNCCLISENLITCSGKLKIFFKYGWWMA